MPCGEVEQDRLIRSRNTYHPAGILSEETSGPSIEAIIVSNRHAEEFHGIPVFELGEKLPTGVQAIVPSSNRYEADMKSAANEAYPDIPWVFLWNSDEEFIRQ